MVLFFIDSMFTLLEAKNELLLYIIFFGTHLFYATLGVLCSSKNQ